MALALAAQILENGKSDPIALAKLDDTLEKVTRVDPELARLATDFADAVTRHGYQSKDEIRTSIDECLKLAFGYSGDGIDLEHDLVIPRTPEPDFDKYPQWIEGASPQMKCEVGRIMAREDIPDGSRWSISQGPLNASHLTFELPDGTIEGPWTLEHSQAFASRMDHIQRINEMNHQNRERQMKHQPTNGMPNFPGQPRRFYMAGTARFLTRVREVEWLGGEHPYAYAENNPVRYIDPAGNNPMQKPAGLASNFGECAVYICDEKTLPGFIGGVIPSHQYICVSGPGGGCSGGLYPSSGGISKGVIQNKGESCASRTQPYRVDCKKIATGCDIASKVCDCVKGSYSDPGYYVFPIRTCIRYPEEQLRCACKKLGVGSILRHDICQMLLPPVIA